MNVASATFLFLSTQNFEISRVQFMSSAVTLFSFVLCKPVSEYCMLCTFNTAMYFQCKGGLSLQLQDIL